MKIFLIFVLCVTLQHIHSQVTCQKYLDWGKRTLCFKFDVANCLTPNNPPSCPILEKKLRHPCVRYRCSEEQSKASTALDAKNEPERNSQIGNLSLSQDYVNKDKQISFNATKGSDFVNEETSIDYGTAFGTICLMILALLVFFYICKRRQNTVRHLNDDRHDDNERGFYAEPRQTERSSMRNIFTRFARRNLRREPIHNRGNQEVVGLPRLPAPKRFQTPPLDQLAPTQSSSKTFLRKTLPINLTHPINATTAQPTNVVQLAPINLWHDQVQQGAIVRPQRPPPIQLPATFAPAPQLATFAQAELPNQDEDLEEGDSDNLDRSPTNSDDSDSDNLDRLDRSASNSDDSDSHNSDVVFYSPPPSPSPSPQLVRRSPRKNKGIGPSRYGYPIFF